MRWWIKALLAVAQVLDVLIAVAVSFFAAAAAAPA